MAHREIPLGRTGSAEYLLRGAWVYLAPPHIPVATIRWKVSSPKC